MPLRSSALERGLVVCAVLGAVWAVACDSSTGEATAPGDTDAGSDAIASDAVGSPDGDPVPVADCNGLPCAAVYVAPGGDDANAGTKDAPLRSIAGAISRASKQSPRPAVFVQTGTFVETIEMQAAVSIYGGFGATWARDGGATEISGGLVGIRFENINAPTRLDRITVRGADATVAGAGAVGVLVVSSSNVELVDCIVKAGAGKSGAAATADGVVGANGEAGLIGAAGCENSAGACNTCTKPLPGAGGTSTCGRTGGAGGDPGLSTASGTAGATGAGGTLGGPKGLGSAEGGIGVTTNGTVGADGTDGPPGPNGPAGAAFGSFQASTYIASNGGDGTVGTPGNGGGGGGGGSGGTNLCDSYGSSGGGGGAGGCAGGRGAGGGGGGASFGVLAFESKITIRGATITAGPAGAGANGGAGAAGGDPGGPGPGGPYGGPNDQDDGGKGAPGGKGGHGGRGGDGGGGGGGPSIALVCVGATNVTLAQSTLVPGVSGAGGMSLAPGAKGETAMHHGCAGL
jgi:hypothetical protein